MAPNSEALTIDLRRVIIFTADVASLAEWYSRVFGFPIREMDAKGGWADLDAGGASLAFHGGGKKRTTDCGHKIVFGVKDVAKAREIVTKRGATLGPVKHLADLELCDGRDPEGNVFQLSNRP